MIIHRPTYSIQMCISDAWKVTIFLLEEAKHLISILKKDAGEQWNLCMDMRGPFACHTFEHYLLSAQAASAFVFKSSKALHILLK